MADFKSEPRPASNRNWWPASCWNAWPASSVSAGILRNGHLDPFAPADDDRERPPTWRWSPTYCAGAEPYAFAPPPLRRTTKAARTWPRTPHQVQRRSHRGSPPSTASPDAGPSAGRPRRSAQCCARTRLRFRASVTTPSWTIKVPRQVFGLDLTALFPPQSDQRRLIRAHDDPGVRAADEEPALGRLLADVSKSMSSPNRNSMIFSRCGGVPLGGSNNLRAGVMPLSG